LVRPEPGFSRRIHQTGAIARGKWSRFVRMSNDEGDRSPLFNSLLSLNPHE
jgi:hypothetical protein